MKRTIKLMAAMVIIYYGCAKMAPEHPEEPAVNDCSPAFPTMNITYNKDVRNIITTHCTVTCHRGGNSLGTGNFTTYTGLVPYLSKFPFRVLADQADMPQGKAPLPRSTRDSLQIWISNCYPEGTSTLNL